MFNFLDFVSNICRCLCTHLDQLEGKGECNSTARVSANTFFKAEELARVTVHYKVIGTAKKEVINIK